MFAEEQSAQTSALCRGLSARNQEPKLETRSYLTSNGASNLNDNADSAGSTISLFPV
jgi:hypothetical protein